MSTDTNGPVSTDTIDPTSTDTNDPTETVGMLTVDYAKARRPGPGTELLDLGCGFGRHAYQAARLGAEVVAFDAGADEVRNVQDTFGAMYEAGELDAETARVGAVRGDALRLPFADGSFDRVIASEVLRA